MNERYSIEVDVMDDELSARNLDIAPLKSSAALSLWAMSHPDGYAQISGIVGLDYVLDAVAVRAPHAPNHYNIKLTLRSESRHYDETVTCFKQDQAKDTKPPKIYVPREEDLPYESAAAMIHFFKQEKNNVAAYEPYRQPTSLATPDYLTKYPFLVTSNHVYRTYTAEEKENDSLNFMADTEEESFIYEDLSHLLKYNDDLSDTTKKQFQRYVALHNDNPHVGIAQAFAINIASMPMRYMPTKAIAARDKKIAEDKAKNQEPPKKTVEWPGPTVPPSKYNEKYEPPKPISELLAPPSLYATYIIGSGRAEFMGRLSGAKRAMEFVTDINEMIIKPYLASNVHHENKRGKQRFLPDIYGEQARTWDIGSTGPIKADENSLNKNLPFSHDNYMFPN